MIQEPRFDMPPLLSMLPNLEELTIHSKLQYDSTLLGFLSPIPAINKLFSCKHSSSLKHLTLDFDFACVGPKVAVLPEFLLPFSVLDVVCTPLVQLLLTISGAFPLIQVDLFLNGNPLTQKPLGPPHFLLSALRDCEVLLNMLEKSCSSDK